MIYTYDGSFEGLLSVFSNIFPKGTAPTEICSGNYSADLFSKPAKITADKQKSEEFITLLENNFDSSMFRIIYLTYLSEIKGFEMYLYAFLKDGFGIGKNIYSHLHLPSVMKIKLILSKVLKETAYLKGFLRFSKLKSGVMYSSIETDHFILPLLASHFKKRFGNFDWIIHDRKRKKALFYENKKYEIVSVINEEVEDKDSSEADIESLWKLFFETISIKSRKNLKLQARLLPKRYRKNMLEFQ